MKCTFTLIHKGEVYTFDNELQLNDFLGARYSMYSSLGDIVFSKKQILNTQINTFDLIQQLNRQSEKLKALKYDTVVSEDSENKVYDPPYVGVNLYLKDFTFTDNQGVEHSLFPIFQSNEYWAHRFKEWSKVGDETRFTDDEIDAFFDGDKQKAATAVITEESSLLLFKSQMEERWKNQCLIGDAIHAVMRELFAYHNEGILIDRIEKLGIKSAINTITSFLSKKSFKAGDLKKEFKEVLTDSKIEDVIVYALNLIKEIRSKYGSNCILLPELTISGALLDTQNGPDKILGSIDLLVIDEDGDCHILDYKVSTKDYSKTNSAKERTYMYLLDMYKKILAHNGVKIDYKTTCEVVPIHIAGFKRLENNGTATYLYDKLEFNNANLIHDLNSKIAKYGVEDRIKNTMVIPDLDDADFGSVYEKVNKNMQVCFPKYNTTQLFSTEEIVEMIKAADGFTPTKNNMLVFAPEGMTKQFDQIPPIDISTCKNKAEAEAKLVLNVQNFYNKSANTRTTLVNNISKCIRDCIKSNDIEAAEWETLSTNEKALSSDWLKYLLASYINNNWIIKDSGKAYEMLRNYGIITLQNTETHLLDFIKISTKPLLNQFKFTQLQNENNLQTYLAGAFKSDLYFDKQATNDQLHCEYGNIELMETMFILNEIPGLFADNNIVGRIQVINPFMGNNVTATNKLLYASFNTLDQCMPTENKIKTNYFKSGNIKMADTAMLVRQLFIDIMSAAESTKRVDREARNIYQKISGCKLDIVEGLSLDMTAEEKLKKIIALRRMLEKDTSFQSRDFENIETYDLVKLSSRHLKLYHLLLIAEADCRGITFKQLLHDHSKWGDSIHIDKNGWTGSYLDNPGLLLSETLNLLTKLCTEAYQNTRDEMADPIAKISALVKKLKEAKGFGYLESRTIGNQSSLYKNMFVDDLKISKGDFLFKNVNDPTLTIEEREFLKEALKIINKDRLEHKFNTEIELEEALNDMEQNNDTEYYQVPLAVASNMGSAVARKSLFTGLKEFLNNFKPSEIVKRFKETQAGLFSLADEYDRNDTSSELFELTNQFEIGSSNQTRRLDNIKSHRVIDAQGNIILDGTQYYESNLETLLLKHKFAYVKTKHLNTVMPTIKAALVHLITASAYLNRKFSNDIDYLRDYVKNKIKSEVIFDKKFEKLGVYGSKIRSAASFLALAFSPAVGAYQFIQSLWNDISLIIRKPDGTEAFTFKNFAKAYKVVFADMVNTTNDRPSVISKFNEIYGVNDMDMNTYIDRIKTDRHGIYNFWTLAFKFSSRPDYYSRMAIFIAKSMADGTYEAHSLKDGKLVYDFKKDARFSAFANNDKSDLDKYNKQRALYFAMALQFIKEHALNPDGSEFTFDSTGKTPLPRAYTNMEAESMKSISDEIYGYYSHEKKSLIQSTALGCMWMLFRTFWSGKKNLFLQKGGVKLEGHWILATNNEGLAMYYLLGKNGEPLYNSEPTTEKNNFPVMVWQGDWKEGIVLTLAKCIGSKQALHDVWYNEDANLRRCYRANIIKLVYDLALFGILGSLTAAGLAGWFKDLKDDSDPDNITDGIKLSAANIAIRSINNSFLDLNFFDSIGAPLINWTPFSFQFLSNTAKSIYETATGDLDFAKMAINMSGIGKQSKYFWNALIPDED